MDLRGILVSLNGGNSWFKQCESCDDLWNKVSQPLAISNRTECSCEQYQNESIRYKKASLCPSSSTESSRWSLKQTPSVGYINYDTIPPLCTYISIYLTKSEMIPQTNTIYIKKMGTRIDSYEYTIELDRTSRPRALSRLVREVRERWCTVYTNFSP